jgi:hypothetical protein
MHIHTLYAIHWRILPKLCLLANSTKCNGFCFLRPWKEWYYKTCSIWPPFCLITSWNRSPMFVMTLRHKCSVISPHSWIIVAVKSMRFSDLIGNAKPTKISRMGSSRGWGVAKMTAVATIRTTVWDDRAPKVLCRNRALYSKSLWRMRWTESQFNSIYFIHGSLYMIRDKSNNFQIQYLIIIVNYSNNNNSNNNNNMIVYNTHTTPHHNTPVQQSRHKTLSDSQSSLK